MRTHTNDFKNAIKELGRQIDGKIYYYPNYNLISESGDTILTEANIEWVSEQFDKSNAIEIDSSLIYSMNIIKNGQLLQSLMKELDIELSEDDLIKIANAILYQISIISKINPKKIYINEVENYLLKKEE